MTSSAILVGEREAFLEVVFSQDMGALEVRPIPPDRKPARGTFVSSIEAALVEIEAAEQRRENVYVGIASRKPGARRGDKAHLEACRLVWIDYDFDEDSARSAITFQSKLDAFPLAPSMVVDSGGGRHVYWRLAEAIDVGDPAGRAWHEAVLRGLARAWSSDSAVTDSSRILRVPGTTNRPPERKRAAGRVQTEARLLLVNESALYDSDAFEAWRAAGVRAPAASSGMPGEIPASVREVAKQRPSLRRLLRYETSGDAGRWVKPTGEPNFSKFDFAMTCELIEAGISRSDIRDACAAVRRANGGNHPKLDGDDYWTRTFEAAYASIPEAAKRERWWYEDGSALRKTILTSRLVNGERERPTPGFIRTPGIPVGLRELDEVLGGFYGLTVLSGREGGGKTMLALMAAVNAAQAGIRVVYFNAETHINVLGERVRRQLGVTFDEMQRATSKIDWIRVRRAEPAPLEFLQRMVVSSLSATDERVLVVFDSLSSITRKIIPAETRDFWRESQRIEEWLVDARTASEGAVTFVAISELNKEGGEKGMTSAYAADVVLRVDRERDGNVLLSVRKSRETARPEDLSVRLNVSRMRFETPLTDAPERGDGKVIELRPARGADIYKDI